MLNSQERHLNRSEAYRPMERGMNDPVVKSRIEKERVDGSGVERG
jgi:hypothetical protein